MAIRSLRAMKENRNGRRSDEDLPLWNRLRLQGRMPVQSVHVQALQLLTAAAVPEGWAPCAFGGGALS